MFRYVVGPAGGPDELYVNELRIQCMLARHSYRELDEYARVVSAKTGTYGHSVLFVIAHCVGFLSAAANISKILFASRSANQGARARSARLLARLNLSSLPTIEARGVRNSFEHIDD